MVTSFMTLFAQAELLGSQGNKQNTSLQVCIMFGQGKPAVFNVHHLLVLMLSAKMETLRSTMRLLSMKLLRSKSQRFLSLAKLTGSAGTTFTAKHWHVD